MDIITSIPFWCTVAVAYVILAARVPCRQTTFFGMLNLAAIWMVLGWECMLAMLAFSCVLWLSLCVGMLARARVWTRSCLWLFGIVLLGLLGLFVAYKYSGPRLSSSVVETSEGMAILVQSFLVSITFSYVFLRAWDVSQRVLLDEKALLNPIALAAYLLPFHMIIAGPICAYEDHLDMDEPRDRTPRFGTLLKGINTITTGLFLKIVVAEAMRIYAFGLDGPIVSASWMTSAFLLVYFYFDFAGYSLVALGIGQLIGVPTPRNFRMPLLSTTVTEFWERWHISLGQFVRRNIFVPLQMYLTRRWGISRAWWVGLLVLCLSFSFTGLWHVLSYGLLLWALGMAVVMMIEKAIRMRATRHGWHKIAWMRWAWRVLGPIYVFAVITTGLHLTLSELIPS